VCTPDQPPSTDPEHPDLGLSHIALCVKDVDRSIDFYSDFAGFEVVHRRGESGRRVVWLSDLQRPFALVLLESSTEGARLDGVSHLGIACASRQQVDQLCERARTLGCLTREPKDAGQPVGYWALLRDPDGHNLELSHGQEVGAQVARARSASAGLGTQSL
jgi:catechol 2,3-dioxygenase-like lactoylglutathione lyase family enzyme